MCSPWRAALAGVHSSGERGEGRVQRRRRLMTEARGNHMAEELLPLSDGAAYLPPFWLANELVCVVSD